jgi:hypothetical protein
MRNRSNLLLHFLVLSVSSVPLWFNFFFLAALLRCASVVQIITLAQTLFLPVLTMFVVTLERKDHAP